MRETIYLNGALVSREQARVSAYDHGFLYGFGLFETMRAYGGRIFRLSRHLERLARSADFLGLPLQGIDLEAAVLDTLKASALASAYVRLTVSPGPGEMRPDPSTCGPPTVMVVAREYQPPSEEAYSRGYRALVSSLRRNSRSPLPQHKTASYLESVLARREAREAGYDEALLLNERNLLAEGSASNVFLVKRGQLRTPRAGCGLLPGIAREAVLEMASSLGIEAVEGEYELDDLLTADEAFLTNSLIEVMPLAEVQGHALGPHSPGPVTEKVRAAYRELVRRETGP